MKPFLILISFVFSVSSWSQITGQCYQDGYPYPMVKVYFENIKPKVTSDFEGTILLKIPKDSISKNLVFQYEGIYIQITNCPLSEGSTIDLGKIQLPKHKQLTLEEYKKLKRKNRKECLPLYQGTTLIGYENRYELDNDVLPFHCPDGKGVSGYVYDKKRNVFTIPWERFVGCE
ncbi:MAG: hypothetical protein R2781_04150 [Flavobacteriaceae bacterium]